MTNKTKTRGLLWAAFGLFLSLAPRVNGEPLEDARIRALNSSWFVLKSSGTSYNPALNLYYVGSATESVVTITSAAALFFAPAGTADTAVSTGGGVALDATTFDTFGEFCDYVDGLANYRCELLGGRRGDNTNLLRDQTAASGTNDLKAAGGFEVHFDSGQVAGGGDNTRFDDLRVGRKPVDGKRLILKSCNATGPAGSLLTVRGKLKIYETNPTGANLNDNSIVWQAPGSTTTWSQNGLGGIEFARDAHVVVSMGDAATDATAAHFLDCTFEEK